MAVSRWQYQTGQGKYKVYRKGVCRKVLHAARSRGGCPTERSFHAMPGDKALPNLANLAPRCSTKRDRASRVLHLPLQASVASQIAYI